MKALIFIIILFTCVLGYALTKSAGAISQTRNANLETVMKDLR